MNWPECRVLCSAPWNRQPRTVDGSPARPTRRSFLKAGGAAVAAGAALGSAGIASAVEEKRHDLIADPMQVVEPFFAAHQGGIVTPQQSHTYVAALDLTTTTMPVDVVAHNAGYESRSSFVRAFRKAHNLDPSEYRQSGKTAEGDKGG